MNAIASSVYHSLHPLGTPPLLPIPLSTPSTSRRAGIPEAVDVCTRESSEFCTRHHDAQKDHAAMRVKIEVLRSERLAYEQEGIQTREALARSEAYCRALEARVAVLETHARRLENSGGGDGSHSSHVKNPKNMHTARPCSYADFMKCPPLNFKGTEGAVKKLEIELWNLKVRDKNIPAYNNLFQELALICTKFVSNETEKVDKYISGL
nr:reverse transcriptase domain-containing protein [Tanacetum cinerariifolium]